MGIFQRERSHRVPLAGQEYSTQCLGNTERPCRGGRLVALCRQISSMSVFSDFQELGAIPSSFSLQVRFSFSPPTERVTQGRPASRPLQQTGDLCE